VLVITGFKTIQLSEFVGLFVTRLRNKCRIPRRK